jgi:DTW domain-containing protein YfiP
MQSPIPRRPVCAACQRAQSACICAWVNPVDPAVDVLILQHPLEVHHAKNSVGLLHRCLPGSRLLVGESFDASTLRAALPADRYVVLLYPATASVGHLVAPPLEPQRLRDPLQVGLVVLDGTWRKSRKMLHCNPLLQSLPRLALTDVAASSYVIRRAHQPGQLSTFEATCAALAQLEGDAQKYRPLQQAFQGFVRQQAARDPAHANA